MFLDDTLFITGAGASFHYGYPTGTGLLTELKVISEKLRVFYLQCQSLKIQDCPAYFECFDISSVTTKSENTAKYDIAIAECIDFQRRLSEADPINIDFFLGENLHLAALGKFLISWVILECEQKNQIRDGNWIRFIVDNMTKGCVDSADLLVNKVKFCTFNYDTSLERRIRVALQARSKFQSKNIEQFLAQDRFFHIYGAVNNGQSSPIDARSEPSMMDIELNHKNTFRIMDKIYSSSLDLQVIDPGNKKVDRIKLKAIQEFAILSEQIYVLGFGFDKINVDLIDFAYISGAKNSSADVYMTNFGHTSAINQRASLAFYGKPHHPLNGTADTERKFNVTKSFKNVNNAFEMDFIMETYKY